MRELPSDETRPPQLSFILRYFIPQRNKCAQDYSCAMQIVKAPAFDVFGTVVDWRTGMVGELKALGEKHAVATGQS